MAGKIEALCKVYAKQANSNCSTSWKLMILIGMTGIKHISLSQSTTWLVKAGNQ